MGSVHAIRNLGIIAHVDAGKTTLAERVLFCADRIHAVRAVGAGATMDSMPEEDRRGISIQAAATTIHWSEHQLNIIDTPGHADFAAEVARSLLAMDGAALLFCGVAGVQARSEALTRALVERGVPRIAFINKMDRPGADARRVLEDAREALGVHGALIQIPLGEGRDLRGVIDLVRWEARYPDGTRGPVPGDHRAAALAAREALLDAASLVSDDLTEALLEEREVTPALLTAALREGCISGAITPFLAGSAWTGAGVRGLLDAIVELLPSPAERPLPAGLRPDPEAPPAALVFKVQADRFGARAWLRVLQGRLRRGDALVRQREGAESRIRVGRLGRLHAGQMSPLEEASCGDIVAVFGSDFAFGDVVRAHGPAIVLPGVALPEPVVEVALRGAGEKLGDALARLTREDPCLQFYTDPETRELRLRGVGELQLEVVAERLRREFKLEVSLGAPEVCLRQTITRRADFDHLHKKQRGGPGQYARLAGFVEPGAPPLCEQAFDFAWEIRGGAVPARFRTAIEAALRRQLAEGITPGLPVIGARVVITDGATHVNDSSELAFAVAARDALRACFEDAGPVTLEPYVKVVARAPARHHGALLAGLTRRRGAIRAASCEGASALVEAEVPLAEMFGYAGALASATAGAGQFSMAFSRYA